MKAVSIFWALILIATAIASTPVHACRTYQPRKTVIHRQTFPRPFLPKTHPSVYTPKTTYHLPQTQTYTYRKYVPREKYIWEAETKEDIKIRNEIEKAQIDYGVSSKEAGQLMLQHAKKYLVSKNYQKAIELTDEIIKINECFKNGIEGVSLKDVQKVRGEAKYRLRPTMVVTSVTTDSIPLRDRVRVVMPSRQKQQFRKGNLLKGKSTQKKLISKL